MTTINLNTLDFLTLLMTKAKARGCAVLKIPEAEMLRAEFAELQAAVDRAHANPVPAQQVNVEPVAEITAAFKDKGEFFNVKWLRTDYKVGDKLYLSPFTPKTGDLVIGDNYAAGLWSHRNVDAMIEDGNLVNQLKDGTLDVDEIADCCCGSSDRSWQICPSHGKGTEYDNLRLASEKSAVKADTSGPDYDKAGLIKEIINRVCKHVPGEDGEDHITIELPELRGILNDCIVAQAWPLPTQRVDSEPTCTIKVWNKGGSGEFKECVGLNKLNDGDKLYLHLPQAAIPDGLTEWLSQFRKMTHDTGYLWMANDAERFLSMLSAAPSLPVEPLASDKMLECPSCNGSGDGGMLECSKCDGVGYVYE